MTIGELVERLRLLDQNKDVYFDASGALSPANWIHDDHLNDGKEVVLITE